MRRLWTRARTVGRVLFMFTTAAVMFAAMPQTVALADPPAVTAPPAGGSRPDGSLPAPVPSGTGLPPTGTAVPGVGPLAAQIQAKNVELAKLAEAAKASGIDVANRAQLVTAAAGQLLTAQNNVNALQTAAADLAGQQYADAQSTPLDLSGLTPEGATGDPAQDLADQLATAQSVLEEAQATYDAAFAAQTRAVQRDTAAKSAYETLNTEVAKLVQDNQKAIADAEKARNEFAKNYSGKFGDKVKGYSAGQKAIDAAKWALTQVGKPYVWGAEGPDSYDCSGLIWRAYKNVGVNLPRIANDQFHATSAKPIGVEYLLPGDLIFYGDRPGDWTSVYHVGMYIGDGKMVQAPTAGQNVKVSPVWFDDYFGATRVIEAVKGDGEPITTPPTTPGGTDGSSSPSPTGSTMFPTPGGSDGSGTPSSSSSSSEPAETPSGGSSSSSTPSGSGSPDPDGSGASTSSSPSAVEPTPAPTSAMPDALLSPSA